MQGNYTGLKFSEFVATVEKELPVKFFYRDEWIEDIKIQDHEGCEGLACILNRAFIGKPLYFLIEESGNIVITRDYAVKVYEEPAASGKYIVPGQDDDRESAGISTEKVVEIGNASEANTGGQATITGYINDQETKEAIVGVTVYSNKPGTGSISNEFGFFSVKLPKGMHQLVFKSIGFREKDINIRLNGSGELNVEMKSESIPLKAVLITSEKNITLQRFEVGVERINMKNFRLQPTTMGEKDILKSLLLIPGVKSVGEGSAGFNVRGGTADQNLILLYGAPLYYSSHFFGFFSAVNPDIIRDVTLFKGGIPPRYGGRISSVVDIGVRDGSRKEFKGNAGISPITTHIMAEGPIIKDTLCYILAARTTYSNWVLGLVNDADLRNSKASYYDLNGKVTYDPDKNNRFEICGLISKDNFRFRYDSVYLYNTHIGGLKWRHFFNTNFFSSVTVNNSYYSYSLSSSQSPSEAFKLSHNLNSTGFKADFNWFKGKHEVNFGVDLTRYFLNPGSLEPNGDSSFTVKHYLEKERALESALYFDDRIALSRFFSIEGGLRFSGFFNYGPGQILKYNRRFPKSKQTITDTIQFGRNDVIKKYFGPEFRLSLNFRLSEKSSFKLNYNRTRQYLHLLTNSAAISPTDIWKLSDYHLSPQVGDQIAAGYYELLRRRHFEFSAEVYYKTIRNMIDFKGGTNIIMNEDIAEDVVSVKGKAYGIEMTLKKTEGKLNFSFAYTFARILQKSTTFFTGDKINGGNWFAANFDRPHDLSLVCSYIFSRRLSFSGNYTLNSGRPITFPVASYILYEDKFVHYSDRNKYRIPDYSRLDLSVTLNGNLRSNKILNPRWTFSIFNVLARKNVYSIYFKRDGDVVKGYKLSIFGRAIPSVTYSFDF